jgi:hypothetical protein
MPLISQELSRSSSRMDGSGSQQPVHRSKEDNAFIATFPLPPLFTRNLLYMRIYHQQMSWFTSLLYQIKQYWFPVCKKTQNQRERKFVHAFSPLSYFIFQRSSSYFHSCWLSFSSARQHLKSKLFHLPRSDSCSYFCSKKNNISSLPFKNSTTIWPNG